MKIIAEIGVNHDGDLSKGLALIEACARAGADYAKFQIFQTSKLATSRAPRAAYQADALGTGSQEDMLRALELSNDAFRALKNHCDAIGIGFLATPFDEESAVFLINDLGCKAVKIGSGDMDNLPLLMRIAACGVDMIVSTGMATIDEIEMSLGAIAYGRRAYQNGEDLFVGAAPTRADLKAARAAVGLQGLAPFLTLLHCTSEYPATHATLNMRALPAMRAAFAPIPIGFSDHSTDDVGAIMAVTLGATVIERHITYDRAARGPDHSASLDEVQFAGMVRQIKRTTTALGTGDKRPSEREVALRSIARKRILAARALKAGHILTLADIALKRSSEGRPAFEIVDILGQRLAHDVDVDAPIEVLAVTQ